MDLEMVCVIKLILSKIQGYRNSILDLEGCVSRLFKITSEPVQLI